MEEVSLRLSDEVLQRLQAQASQLELSLEEVINQAIAYYLEDEEPTQEEFLEGLKQSMREVLAGDYRPAREVLEELD